jgi:hypothetical protein
MLDDTHFPLVEVQVLDGHRDGDWDWLLRRFERLFERRQRYALFIDATCVNHVLSPAARRMVTDWELCNLRNTAKWNVGTSVVICSGLIRGALTAMNWFAQQPVPMHYPGKLHEGLAWCVSKLEGEYIPVPPPIRARLANDLLEASNARLRNSG